MKKVNILFKILFFFFIASYSKYSDSFSQVSLELMKKLNDVVVVNVFISDDLPPQYGSLKSDVIKLLTEYEKLSSGKLIVEKYESKPNSYMEDQAVKYGVQPVLLKTLVDNEIVNRKAFMGLSCSYSGQDDIIPFIESTVNFEYKINKIIYYFSRDKKKKIGFLKGHDELDYSRWEKIINTLSKHYEIADVEISEFNPVPEDIDVLIIIAPKTPFPESHKFMIDQFIMRGGNVAWLINKVIPNTQQGIILGEFVNTNLDDILLNYGIKINDDLVRDLNCAQILMPSQTNGFTVNVDYQFFPLVKVINNEIAAFGDIQNIVLPFVSSISRFETNGEQVNFMPLLKTSDKSGRDEGFFILNPDRFNNLSVKERDSLFARKGIVLGATCEGKFISFYSGKRIPQANSKDIINGFKGEILDSSIKESRMVIIGDGDFPNELNKPPQDNIKFFYDIIEYLSININLNEHIKN